MTRTYTELILLPTYDERYDYCDLFGKVGVETFGYDRWVNQALYSSQEWKKFRRDIILRDSGCEFALPGFEIAQYGVIHHLNPISKEDILSRSPCVFDPNNVVLVSRETHNFIHYGRGPAPSRIPTERRPNDTCPWR